MKKKESNDKNAEILSLTNEILTDFDLERLSLEQIVLKCKRLSRIIDDYDALNWLTLELHGYSDKTIPDGIKESELLYYAKKSGRQYMQQSMFDNKLNEYYWITSIPELEAIIKNSEISLQALKLPESFTPAITKWFKTTMVVESYRDVLTAFTTKQTELNNNIKSSKLLLAKIRNSVYSYIMNKNIQTRFENITETVFQNSKNLVDQRLNMIAPNAIKKFTAAYERFNSDNPESLSQALSSCRNILKDFADYVFPPADDKYTLKNGDIIDITEDKYKNRILAFIDASTKSTNYSDLLKSRLTDLANTLHSLNAALSQGAKNTVDETMASFCLIETYLLLANLLFFVK